MAAGNRNEYPARTCLQMGSRLISSPQQPSYWLALGFEHIGNYDPCALCLQQRYAYYIRNTGTCS